MKDFEQKELEYGPNYSKVPVINRINSMVGIGGITIDDLRFIEWLIAEWRSNKMIAECFDLEIKSEPRKDCTSMARAVKRAIWKLKL